MRIHVQTRGLVAALLLLLPPLLSAASPPTVVSVTPSSGSGTTQTFALLYSDAGGVEKMTYVQALINGSLSFQNSCAVLYYLSTNRLYLVNDAGNGWQGPLTPGQAGTLSNSQCTLNGGASSISAAGNNLTVNAALTFKPAFGGNKAVYMDAEDTLNNLSSGWQSRGTWTVPLSAPVAVSVTPSSGSGSSQTFALLYSDAAGVGKITYVQALINGSLSFQNSCAVLYYQSTNRLYLVLDSGAGWQGPLTPGQAGTLSNSQCTLNGGTSSVSAVGNNLTVNAALTFKPAFGGNKTVYMDAEDTPDNLSSGWQSRGSWTVPLPVPVAVSVTPSSGSGTSQTFALLYSDAGGVGKITYAQALINASLSFQNSCAVLYYQSTNRLYLVLDSGSGWQGSLTPGQAGTLQNSQCTLNGGASSVSAVGNNLTVNAALTFKPAFAGSKTVFLDAEDVPNHLSSGFQALGSWTAAYAPTAVSVTPSSGSGASQTFSFLFSDAGGANQINYIQALINGSLAWPNACGVLYYRGSNTIYLVQDSGSGWLGPLTVGQAGTLQNKQCTLDAGATSVLASGNDLTVNVVFTFMAQFTGGKSVFGLVQNNSGSSSDWQQLGAWTATSVVEDWPKYRRDLANSGRSAENFLSSANASTLKKKWQFTVDTCCGATPGHQVSASPAVATVGGVRTVYVGAWSGFFYAINADTGAQIWRFEVDRTGSTRCTATTRCRIGSSAAVDNGMVYFGAENAYVYGLNALTGALVWKRQLGDPEAGAEIWSSPATYNGLVYVGLSSHNDDPCVAGKMIALNAADGTIAWSFDAIVQSTCPMPPGPGNCVGVGIWSSAAIDTQFGIMYIGTGNAGNSCIPTTAKATQDYSDGILGLSLASGTLKSFYQTNSNDTGDVGDIGAAPVLHQVQSINECTSSTATTYWLTEASKDQKVWTGARDANGMPSASSLLVDDGGNLIATAGMMPYSQTQSCGSGSLRQSSSDFYQPTSNGNLYRMRQAFNGTTSQLAKIPINVSGGCATPGNCPLFSAPASTNDMLFFGGGEGNFYGYRYDGTKIFSFGTLGLVPGGPAISNGRLYIGSYDGNVYCLSLNGQ